MDAKRIHVLDQVTANKIAAGEVVERPSAVVKELVENAMDAGATQIVVEVRQGGKTYMRISDNGSGIHRDDIMLSLERHATSKIRTVKDLDCVLSLGFRGEALASISSVSMMEIITRTADSEAGYRVETHGGRTVSLDEIGAAKGTTVVVRDLFYNTPARMKFMKSNGAELAAITEWISRLAVSKPGISFRFIADHNDVFMTSGNGKLLEAVAAVYERSLTKSLIGIDTEKEGINLTGFIGDLSLNRGNRQMQHFFVNGRAVRSNLLSEAVEMAYQGMLPVNRFPLCFIHLSILQSRLDVNIHPAKIQIRFQDESHVRQTVFQMIRETLLNRNLMPVVRHRMEAVSPVPVAQSSTLPVSEVSVNTAVPINPVQPLTREEPIAYVAANERLRDEARTEEPVSALPQLLVKPVAEQVMLSPELESPFSGKTLYDDLQIIGQVFKTYILAERGDSLYLIDQHAAHEKVLYEKFMRDWKLHQLESQLLLVPELIAMEPQTVIYSEELKAPLESAGFVYDTFGADAILVREVPVVGLTPLSPHMLKDLLQSFSQLIAMEGGLSDIRQEAIIREACKKAIKAQDILSLKEIEGLIAQLKGLDSPYTCPHGRPIIISIERSELEHRFRRG